MFEYPTLPYMEEEARAAIWAALQELAHLVWRERWIDERAGANEGDYERERMDIEYRQGIAIAALNNYSGQHWLSRAEYSEWWSATIGESETDICRYLFEY